MDTQTDANVGHHYVNMGQNLRNPHIIFKISKNRRAKMAPNLNLCLMNRACLRKYHWHYNC